jgi:hypothetical protein
MTVALVASCGRRRANRLTPVLPREFSVNGGCHGLASSSLASLALTRASQLPARRRGTQQLRLFLTGIGPDVVVGRPSFFLHQTINQPSSHKKNITQSMHPLNLTSHRTRHSIMRWTSYLAGLTNLHHPISLEPRQPRRHLNHRAAIWKGVGGKRQGGYACVVLVETKVLRPALHATLQCLRVIGGHSREELQQSAAAASAVAVRGAIRMQLHLLDDLAHSTARSRQGHRQHRVGPQHFWCQITNAVVDVVHITKHYLRNPPQSCQKRPKATQYHRSTQHASHNHVVAYSLRQSD